MTETPVDTARPAAEPAPPIAGRFVGGSEGYFRLVWRRFRRSIIGMIGLVLVALLLLTAVFADFVAPMNPKESGIAFAPPDAISFTAPDKSLTLRPRIYPTIETGELDQVTFQPLTGPDYDHPHELGFFVDGADYWLLGLFPTNVHFFGTLDGSPVHFLGTDKFGRDILSRGIVGSRISLMIALIVVTITTTVGTIVGISSGYIGGRFDAWLQRFVELVLAFPQLPLYLALTSLIPITAPSNVFIAFVIALLAAHLARQLRPAERGKERYDEGNEDVGRRRVRDQRGQRQVERQLGEGEDQLDEALQPGVEPAADIAGRDADNRPDRRGDRDDDQGDHQGNA